MTRTWTSYAIILLAGMLMLVSCSDERNVDTVNYLREMRNFINESLDGQELYSTDIYPTEKPFALDETDDRYYFQINHVSRSISVDSVDLYEPPKDIYPFNYINDAVAVIDDDITGNIYRIRENDTTLAYRLESSVQRFAYFFKLYNDYYQYHGWRFWGYSTLNYSIDGVFTASDASFAATAASSLPNYRLGRYYVVNNDIAMLPLGDSLTFTSNYEERIFAEDKDEVITAYHTVPIESENVMGWRIPMASDKFYHLITFDMGFRFKVDTLSADGDNVVIESTMVRQNDYVIPYKVDI